MKRFTVFLAVLALFAVASADSLRSQIEAMNAKLHAVMMKKDVDGFVKIVKGGITKDFKYSENGKTVSFDEMVAGMRQGLGSMSKMTVASSKILSLKEKGNSATCTSQHTMAGITMGKDKKQHKLEFTGVSTDTYRKEGGKWMMSGMAWGKQQMKMDGKVFDPGKAGG